MKYIRIRHSKRNPERDEITREFALQMLSGGHKTGPAALRRLEALERGERIDPKFSLGFTLEVEP